MLQKLGTPSKREVEEALSDWPSCNEFLRAATETEAKAILDAELKGKRRTQFLLRAHARFNRQRGKRERAELLSVAGD